MGQPFTKGCRDMNLIGAVATLVEHLVARVWHTDHKLRDEGGYCRRCDLPVYVTASTLLTPKRAMGSHTDALLQVVPIESETRSVSSGDFSE